MWNTFVKLYSGLSALVETIVILLIPVVWVGQAGWAVFVMYMYYFPISIPIIILIFYLLYKLTKKAIVKLFTSNSFGVLSVFLLFVLLLPFVGLMVFFSLLF